MMFQLSNLSAEPLPYASDRSRWRPERIARIALEPHDVALAERMSHLMPHRVA